MVRKLKEKAFSKWSVSKNIVQEVPGPIAKSVILTTQNASGNTFSLLQITQKGSVPYEIDPIHRKTQMLFANESGKPTQISPILKLKGEPGYFPYKAII